MENSMTDKGPAAPSKKDTAINPTSLNPWDAIEVGRVVLWRESKDEGWFECKVIAISDDRKTLTLKWRDYPTFKQFDVKRIAVGLICKMS